MSYLENSDLKTNKKYKCLRMGKTCMLHEGIPNIEKVITIIIHINFKIWLIKY